MSQFRKKSRRSVVGAPSQHTQSSRKGKRAWRKNVSIDDVERGLESIRAEERLTGTALQKVKDSDLFQVDLTGDDKIRKSLPKYADAQLTSTRILAQRSAVPAVASRVSTSKKRKPVLSRGDKEKLLRIAKKPRKGPFNSIMDPSEYTSGSSVFGLSEAVKNSGTYDPWAPKPQEEDLKDGLETVQAVVIKAPSTKNTRNLIKLPAITEPHPGTSYNPPTGDRHELLLRAASIEQKRIDAAKSMATVKTRMESCRTAENFEDISVAVGMTVQDLGEDENEDVPSNSFSYASQAPTRKTRSQRNKEARLAAERRVLAERVHRRRLMASVNNAKNIIQASTKVMLEREQDREQKQLSLKEKIEKQGLVGMRIGKHKVPEPHITVQVGENLSESLRGLQVEGNLFHDRFQSLQQRALIEPRVRLLPKRRKRRIVEYEKHAWKRFE